jgi:hypothetical protein
MMDKVHRENLQKDFPQPRRAEFIEYNEAHTFIIFRML